MISHTLFQFISFETLMYIVTFKEPVLIYSHMQYNTNIRAKSIKIR